MPSPCDLQTAVSYLCATVCGAGTGKQGKTDKMEGSEAVNRGHSKIECWKRYSAWNDAVAQVIYPFSSDASPAYMDLEEDVLATIAKAAGEDGRQTPRRALATAVAGVTVDDDGFSLEVLADRMRRWKRSSVEPPPCLAFLALTVLAAEDMGKSEKGLASNAYYARLARYLGLSDDDRALQRSYRGMAEALWASLNRWLENHEGERGLPTAFALTHRYVGLPMSQALVKEADRRRLPIMFSEYGLSPGMQLAPNELATYLDAWISQEPSTATAALRGLWKRAETHDRIAALAAIALESWDGHNVAERNADTPGRVLLIANFQHGFMGSTLELALGLRPTAEMADGVMEICETSREWSALSFTPGVAGLWRNSDSKVIDFGSIFEGVLRIRHPGLDQHAAYKRQPRPVVPFVYDEMQSAYVQSDRLQLGIDSLVLARQVAPNSGQPTADNEVERVLRESARPGFNRIDAIDGLPTGWTLFTGVQLFAMPTTRLNELVPLARNQLTVAGGLRIPSRISKWSSRRPPEIRATVEGGELNLQVSLTDIEKDELLNTWTSDTGSLVIRLADLALADGDYRASLSIVGKKIVKSQELTIRLRSGDSIDELSWQRAPRLTYILDTPLGVLSASEGAHENRVVDGLACVGATGIAATVEADSEIPWSKPRQHRIVHKVAVGRPESDSCVSTGAHRLKLPTAYGGPQPKYIDGICTSCGLVKRLPGRLPRPGRRGMKEHNFANAALTVDSLPAVSTSEVDWNAAFDAVIHLGGGSISSLDSIARQLEGSALFADTFVRALESLGHVAIERDSLGRPVRWELSHACLSQMTNSQYRLTGGWSQKTCKALSAKFGEDLFRTVDSTVGPSETWVLPLADPKLARIAKREEASIVADSGEGLLGVLPTVSEVGKSLPRISLPGFESAEIFDIDSASWLVTADVSSAGAYRLKRGFEKLYIFRDYEDIGCGKASVAGVRLVKHLAANLRGKTLTFYIERTGSLFVPRGCELPGLYDRAAVAFSGLLPEPTLVKVGSVRRNCLRYADIERSSADQIVTLLTT